VKVGTGSRHYKNSSPSLGLEHLSKRILNGKYRYGSTVLLRSCRKVCGSKLGKKQRLVHFATRALQIKMETRKRFTAPLESSSPMSRERTPPTIERTTFRSLSVVARVADMSEDVRRMRPARWIDPRTGIIQPYSLRPAQGAAILQVIVSCAQSLAAACPLCAS